MAKTKSSALDSNTVEELKVWPPCKPFDDLKPIVEVKETINSMSNRKVVGPGELPAQLPKLASDRDCDVNRRTLEKFHVILIAIWHGGRVPQEWKATIIIVVP